MRTLFPIRQAVPKSLSSRTDRLAQNKHPGAGERAPSKHKSPKPLIQALPLI